MLKRFLKRIVLALLVLGLLSSPWTELAEASVSISFQGSGDLQFMIAETARSSSELYQIVGWTVRKERYCQDPRLEVWDQQCDPSSSEGVKAEFRTFTKGSAVTLRGREYTTYSVPKAEVEKLLQKEGFTDVREGQDLYFSAIFKLYRKDSSGKLTPMSGEYKALQSVIKAQDWRVKSGFRQYYDIPVKFVSKNPLYIQYKDSKGQALSAPKLLGEYAAGAFPGPIVLDRSINVNGTTLDLAGSWIERLSDKEPRSKRYEVDGSVTTRNITVAYGGSMIVAVYDGEGSRVDARFIDESGKTLKTDAYVGHYRTGQTAKYAFPAQVSSGGQIYKLTKTYQTSRADAKRVFFEQSGEGMQNRQLEVESGGHYLWGVYRKTAEPAVTVSLSLHIPEHVPSGKTNVTGTLEALMNTNNVLDRYEIIGLSNATLVNPSQAKGTLSGQSRSLSLAVNVPLSGATASVSATIRVYIKNGEYAEARIGHTVMKHVSGGSSSMDTSHQTVIASVDRGNERFHVAKGIPSSEKLYANVTEAKEYLSDFQYKAVSGIKKYPVTVSRSYTPYWYETVNEWGDCTRTKKDGTEETYSCITGSYEVKRTGSSYVASKTYEVERPFIYYVANKFALYGIDHAKLSNGSLPGGSVRIDPTGYKPPSSDSWHGPSEADHLIDAKVTSSSVTLPGIEVYQGSWSGTDFYSGFQAKAESQVGKVRVRNDRILVNGTTVMNDAWTDESAPVPGKVPEPKKITNNVLYKQPIQIPPKTINSVYSSSGYLRYSLLNGLFNPADKVNIQLGPNPVTVHTPVVNDSVIPDDNRPFDQRTDAYRNDTKPVIVLDRPFTVEFDETAPHLSIPGYGDRDYSAYTDQKRVRFPFDVFDESGKVFYPTATWIDIPVGTPSMIFQLPTWVNEGDYEVTTQAWAINRQPGETCQMDLNGDRSIQCAERIIEVSVTGRLHSFQVTDIGDFRFEKVFRKSQGSLDPSGAAYVSGINDANGDAVPGRDQQWTLPIRKGSHPTEKDTVAHNGYPIKYTVKSIGNYWDKGDGVRVEPTFWFVAKDGLKRQQVDLYYDAAGEKDKMIRVGSEEDKKLYTRSYVLAAPERNIAESELKFAAEYEYNHIMTATERNQKSWNTYYQEYKTRKTAIGKGYDINILPYKARTLVGPVALPKDVDQAAARRSVQQWYGEYNIPIAPYILPQGTNIQTLASKYKSVLTGRESEFLKGGYIIVNFNVYMVRGNDENRMLGYQTPHTDMWQIEGQSSKTGAFTFQSGDIILFESDYSARNDFDGASR